MALGARFKAERGEFCECEEPELVGLDLMCGKCLCENREQIAKRERAINEPHNFVPRGESGIMARFCKVCARFDDDWRHDPARKEQG